MYDSYYHYYGYARETDTRSVQNHQFTKHSVHYSRKSGEYVVVAGAGEVMLPSGCWHRRSDKELLVYHRDIIYSHFTEILSVVIIFIGVIS